ncbi:MAG: response regulator [Anaeromyxobacteraceae bacterium]
MPKQHLLVADADPESLRVLEVTLRNAGFTVTTAASGPDALQRCRAARPDLVLCDVELPGLDGFELCRAVRGDERFRDTPFILLTREHGVGDKHRGLELGVEEFLDKPVFVREAVARVKLALDRRANALLAGDGRLATSSGELAGLGVVDLVHALAAGHKTGVVRVTRAGGGAGTMRFREGRLVACEAGRLAGEAAFHRLLRWRDGGFFVEAGTDPSGAGREPGAIASGTHELLMEGMRRLDEWGRVVEGLPPLDRSYQIDYRLLSDRLAEIPDDVNGLLKLVDGRRTLEEVIEAAPGGDDLAAATVLSKLYFEGIIAPAPPAGARGAAHEPARPRTGATPSPERVDWFAGPVGAEAAPRGSPTAAPEDAPPRIVRFPAKPRPAAEATPALPGVEAPLALPPAAEPAPEAAPPGAVPGAGASAAPDAVASRPPPAFAARGPAPRSRVRKVAVVALAVAALAAAAFGLARTAPPAPPSAAAERAPTRAP